MGHAERLSLPLEISGPKVFERDGQIPCADRKPASLRGRCALLLLLAMSASGYGAMFYFGQAFLVK